MYPSDVWYILFIGGPMSFVEQLAIRMVRWNMTANTVSPIALYMLYASRLG